MPRYRRISTPVWAYVLVQDIADDHGIEMPALRWHRLPREVITRGYSKWRPQGDGTMTRHVRQFVRTFPEDASEGKAWYPSRRRPTGEIMVRTTDDNGKRCRKTVLHEMAHILAGAGSAHSADRFYPILYRLVEQYGERLGLDLSTVAAWEADYKSSNAVEGLRLHLGLRRQEAAA